MSSLIHFTKDTVNGELTPQGQRAGADSGDPQVGVLSADAGEGIATGIWECAPGGWPVIDRPNTETCYILSGHARLTDDATGAVTEIGPGDFVVLPVGWTGRWDIDEQLRKAYTIF